MMIRCVVDQIRGANMNRKQNNQVLIKKVAVVARVLSLSLCFGFGPSAWASQGKTQAPKMQYSDLLNVSQSRVTEPRQSSKGKVQNLETLIQSQEAEIQACVPSVSVSKESISGDMHVTVLHTKNSRNLMVRVRPGGYSDVRTRLCIHNALEKIKTVEMPEQAARLIFQIDCDLEKEGENWITHSKVYRKCKMTWDYEKIRQGSI